MTTMTFEEAEALEALMVRIEGVPRRFAVQGNMGALIRTADATCDCPLVALACHEHPGAKVKDTAGGHDFVTVKALAGLLGVPQSVIETMMGAADDWQRMVANVWRPCYPPTVRARLLKACRIEA